MWYPLPGQLRGGWVTVPMRGKLNQEQWLAVQVATGDPAIPNGVRTVPLPAVGDKPDWTQLAIALADAGLAAPTAVRVVAQDRVAGPTVGWLSRNLG